MGVTWSCNAKANVPRKTLEVLRDNGLRLLLVGYEWYKDQAESLGQRTPGGDRVVDVVGGHRREAGGRGAFEGDAHLGEVEKGLEDQEVDPRILEQPDLLGDVVGSAAVQQRLFDIERPHVLEKASRIQRRNLPRTLAGASRAGLHLVLAGVGIRREVPNICDVHHMPDIKPLRLKDPAHQVGKDVGA